MLIEAEKATERKRKVEALVTNVNILADFNQRNKCLNLENMVKNMITKVKMIDNGCLSMGRYTEIFESDRVCTCIRAAQCTRVPPHYHKSSTEIMILNPHLLW